MQFQVASEETIDIDHFAYKLGGSSGLTLIFSQLGKPGQGRHVGRIGSEQVLQLAALGGDVASMAGEPGAQPMGPFSIRLRGWHVSQRLFHDVDPVSREGPIQPGAPDRNIVGTGNFASIEPARGLVVVSGSDRQVRST